MKKQSKWIIAGVAAIALIIAVLVIVAFMVSGGTDEYDTHLETARRYLDELNYERAVAELRMAIEIEPNESAAYLDLAEVYVAMEDYENAFAVLEEGYAATGDAELFAEGEQIAREYAGLQEQQLTTFCEKYAELYTMVTEAFSGSRGYFDRYLTFAEREQVYGGMAELLEQYLAELDVTEGLPEDLYGSEATAHAVDNTFYYCRGAAYMYLADIYLRMGKLEDCLRVRTEWAAFCGRPDLAEDGNHGAYRYEDDKREYDKYGRVTGVRSETNGMQIQSVYVYGEEHDGATHWTETGSAEGMWEDEYTYDSEGRISHWHRVITREDEGVTVIDNDYEYTGNHSFVVTSTSVRPGRTTDPAQGDERFYDEYGREISP